MKKVLSLVAATALVGAMAFGLTKANEINSASVSTSIRIENDETVANPADLQVRFENPLSPDNGDWSKDIYEPLEYVITPSNGTSVTIGMRDNFVCEFPCESPENPVYTFTVTEVGPYAFDASDKYNVLVEWVIPEVNGTGVTVQLYNGSLTDLLNNTAQLETYFNGGYKGTDGVYYSQSKLVFTYSLNGQYEQDESVYYGITISQVNAQ